MKEENKSIKMLAQAALVAALAFVVFEFLKIPVSQTTSIHLGNAFVVLGALLLGGLWGGLAGAVGLSLGDLLSGYLTSAPKTFILKLVIGLVAGFVAKNLLHIREKTEEKDQLRIATVSSAVALGLNCILDPIFGYFYKMYILGQPQELASTLAKISSVATLVNAIACTILVAIAWPLLYKGLKKANLLVW